jgi:NhaA family Na+:H+ antiporter
LWYTFLISGIHPTIAAVLVAFTIPARPKVSKLTFSRRLEQMLDRFRGAKVVEDAPVVSEEQLKIVRGIRKVSKMAVTPLQSLEYGLHPFVSFVVMPVFALSNAGVTFTDNIWDYFFSPISMGVFFGLLIGKVLGIGLVITILLRFKLAKLPAGMNRRHILGLGMLAAIGFTMSLFISGLAFSDQEFLAQAKLAILLASTIAGIAGYFVLRTSDSPQNPDTQKKG